MISAIHLALARGGGGGVAPQMHWPLRVVSYDWNYHLELVCPVVTLPAHHLCQFTSGDTDGPTRSALFHLYAG